MIVDPLERNGNGGVFKVHAHCSNILMYTLRLVNFTLAFLIGELYVGLSDIILDMYDM